LPPFWPDIIDNRRAKDLLHVDFHFRIGVHVGDVYSFYDPGRKDWNYIGDGINGVTGYWRPWGRRPTT